MSSPLRPDQLLFQILPLRHLESLLCGQITLVSPASWEDPYEALPQYVQMVDPQTTPYTIDQLERYLSPIYAQCWSRTGDSDALLRAYSRYRSSPDTGRNVLAEDEGVKIVSSPERLLRATSPWRGVGRTCHLEPIEYLPQHTIHQHIVNKISTLGPHEAGRGPVLAQLYLLKREWFAHENEVRLLCIDHLHAERKDKIQIGCDINDFIVSIEFDPRLKPFERLERQQFVRSKDYRGEFIENPIYQGPMLNAVFPNGWPKEESRDQDN